MAWRWNSASPSSDLQRADLLAQRWLLHAQLLGRPRDVAGLGHGHEVAQVAKLHMQIICDWPDVQYLTPMTRDGLSSRHRSRTEPESTTMPRLALLSPSDWSCTLAASAGADLDPVRRQQLHLRPCRPGDELQRRQRARPDGTAQVPARQHRRQQRLRAAPLGRRGRHLQAVHGAGRAGLRRRRCRPATPRRCAATCSTPTRRAGTCAATSARRPGARSCCRSRATSRWRRRAGLGSNPEYFRFYANTIENFLHTSATSATIRDRDAFPGATSAARQAACEAAGIASGTCSTKPRHLQQCQCERCDRGLPVPDLGPAEPGRRRLRDQHR